MAAKFNIKKQRPETFFLTKKTLSYSYVSAYSSPGTSTDPSTRQQQPLSILNFNHWGGKEGKDE